ncbi:MAG: hypothetical protein QM768_03705 [Agriterribacter sp.]
MNSYNCSSFVIDQLDQINIHLPSTKTNLWIFNGCNPGNLGEDIRALNNVVVSAQNGGRAVSISRDDMNSNNKMPVGRTGNCQ